jgi:aspartate racemase
MSTIGILAGMGPRSTAPFVDMVVTECQRQYGAKLDEEFPPMMIYSMPTPFYIDRPIDHTKMKQTIIDGLRRLEDTGVTFIAMPCNSAHIYFGELTKCVDVPLLNMIDEAVGCVPESTSRVALIGTRPTIESNIYQRAIQELGLRIVHDSATQTRVDALIQSIKTSTDKHKSQRMWDDLQLDMMAKGADTFLIACTDLDAIVIDTAATVIDATHCLAAAAVRRWTEIAR